MGDQIEHSAIVLVDLAGRHMRILHQLSGFRGSLAGPRLSPDGKRLTFYQQNSDLVRPSGGQAIFVMAVGVTKTLRPLTPWVLRASNPAWSPDGKTILFRSTKPAGGLSPGNNLYSIHSDSTALRQLTHLPAQNYVSSASHSRDRDAIVFATDAGAMPNPGGGTLADVFTAPIGSDHFALVTRTANLELTPAWGRAAG